MKKSGKKAKRKPSRGPRAPRVVRVSRDGPRSRPRLSRGRKDRVQWENLDTVPLRIVFAKWPFTGKLRAIRVPTGRASAMLTVGSKAANGKHRYAIIVSKSVPQGKGPPNPPVVTVGG